MTGEPLVKRRDRLPEAIDGKEMSYQIPYREGKDEKRTDTSSVDATDAKRSRHYDDRNPDTHADRSF
jgi:hypothetical protein